MPRKVRTVREIGPRIKLKRPFKIGNLTPREIQMLRRSAEQVSKELLGRERKEQETLRLAEVDGFIKRAGKVGLKFTREQAEFLMSEFAPDKHDHWDGKVGIDIP